MLPTAAAQDLLELMNTEPHLISSRHHYPLYIQYEDLTHIDPELATELLRQPKLWLSAAEECVANGMLTCAQKELYGESLSEKKAKESEGQQQGTAGTPKNSSQQIEGPPWVYPFLTIHFRVRGLEHALREHVSKSPPISRIASRHIGTMVGAAARGPWQTCCVL